MRKAVGKLVNINLDNVKPYYRTKGPPSHFAQIIVTDRTERLLFKKVSRFSMHGNVIYHLGTRIPAIISEEVQLLGLMVELHSLTNVLRHARPYRSRGRIVRFFCYEYPRAKFLEIGAGTGGCTQHILQALDKRGDGHNP